MAFLSLSFVEPHRRDRSKKPDESAPRHVPRNVGLQDLTRILLPRKASTNSPASGPATCGELVAATCSFTSMCYGHFHYTTEARSLFNAGVGYDSIT